MSQDNCICNDSVISSTRVLAGGSRTFRGRYLEKEGEKKAKRQTHLL